MNKDFQKLRQVLGGSDPFVDRGHQIVELRKRKRKVPEWTKSFKEIQKVLLRAFPDLKTNLKQRSKAARWGRIIHLYFRLQWTYRQVAEELEIAPGSVRDAVVSIRRVAEGKRADTRGERGLRPRGRPARLGKNNPSVKTATGG